MPLRLTEREFLSLGMSPEPTSDIITNNQDDTLGNGNNVTISQRQYLDLLLDRELLLEKHLSRARRQKAKEYYTQQVIRVILFLIASVLALLIAYYVILSTIDSGNRHSNDAPYINGASFFRHTILKIKGVY